MNLPTVTPPGRQQVATITPIRPAAYPGSKVAAMRRPPRPPEYDLQVLQDALAVTKQIVRELTHHATEAELTPGRHPADPRTARARQHALALARAVLNLRPKPPARAS